MRKLNVEIWCTHISKSTTQIALFGSYFCPSNLKLCVCVCVCLSMSKWSVQKSAWQKLSVDLFRMPLKLFPRRASEEIILWWAWMGALKLFSVVLKPHFCVLDGGKWDIFCRHILAPDLNAEKRAFGSASVENDGMGKFCFSRLHSCAARAKWCDGTRLGTVLLYSYYSELQQ